MRLLVPLLLLTAALIYRRYTASRKVKAISVLRMKIDGADTFYQLLSHDNRLVHPTHNGSWTLLVSGTYRLDVTISSPISSLPVTVFLVKEGYGPISYTTDVDIKGNIESIATPLVRSTGVIKDGTATICTRFTLHSEAYSSYRILYIYHTPPQVRPIADVKMVRIHS